VDFAAGIDARPLAVGGVDFSIDFERKGKTCTVAEGEAGVPSDRSQISRKAGLRFGKWFYPGEQAEDRVYARIAGEPKIEELGPDLGVVGSADDGTFDDI
jgi:hypothetical protein